MNKKKKWKGAVSFNQYMKAFDYILHEIRKHIWTFIFQAKASWKEEMRGKIWNTKDQIWLKISERHLVSEIKIITAFDGQKNSFCGLIPVC